MLPEIDRMKEGKGLMKKMAEIKNKINRSAGFTLTEMLATIAILIMVSGGLATGIGLGVKQYNKLMKRSEAQILLSTIQSAVSNELAYSDSPRLLNDVKSDNSGTTKSDSTEPLHHVSTNPIAITTTSYRLKSTKYFSFFSKGDYGDDLNTYGTTSGFGQIYLGENTYNDSDEDVNLPLLGRAAYSDGLAAKVTIDEFNPDKQYFTVTVQIADLSDSSDSKPDIIAEETFQVLRLNGVATGTASETSSKTITVPTPVPTGTPKPTPTPTPLQLIAQGATSYTILETKFAGVRFSAKAEGGSNPYTFAWSVSDQESISSIETQSNTTALATKNDLKANSNGTKKVYTFTCSVTDSGKPDPQSASITNTLTLIGELKVTVAPESTLAAVGDTVTLTATVQGGTGDSRTYQWYKNGTAISGATSETYVISSAELKDAGSYTCVVNDGSDDLHQEKTSNAATVKVAKVTVTPDSGKVIKGNTTKTATFTAKVEGVTDLPWTYQWYGPNGALANKTASTLTVDGTYSAGEYYCVATANGKSIKSTNSATLSVIEKLTVTVNPSSASIDKYSTKTATFTASATGGTGNYSYQWYDPSGNAITGATGTTLTVSGQSAAGSYKCVVTDSAGTEYEQTADDSATLEIAERTLWSELGSSGYHSSGRWDKLTTLGFRDTIRIQGQSSNTKAYTDFYEIKSGNSFTVPATDTFTENVAFWLTENHVSSKPSIYNIYKYYVDGEYHSKAADLETKLKDSSQYLSYVANKDADDNIVSYTITVKQDSYLMLNFTSTGNNNHESLMKQIIISSNS